jgi:hypothetical protein
MTRATRRSRHSRPFPCRRRRGRRRWISGLAGGATCTRPTGSTCGLDCTRRTGWRAGRSVERSHGGDQPQQAHARESQWPQVADFVAHTVFQAIERTSSRAFMWEWYEQRLGAVIVRDERGRHGVQGLRGRRTARERPFARNSRTGFPPMPAARPCAMQFRASLGCHRGRTATGATPRRQATSARQGATRSGSC